MLYKAVFSSPAHSMLYLPITLDSRAQTVLVGFADGVVRALLLCSDAWKVVASFKPHSGRPSKLLLMLLLMLLLLPSMLLLLTMLLLLPPMLLPNAAITAAAAAAACNRFWNMSVSLVLGSIIGNSRLWCNMHLQQASMEK